MEKKLLNHKDEIFETYKKHFQRLYLKNINLTHHEVCECVSFELDIKLDEIFELNYLIEFYNNIYNQDYLMLILNNDIEELIVHRFDKIQSIGKNGKHTFNLECMNHDEIQLSYEVMALKNMQSWNYSEPFVSFNVKINQNDFRCTLIHSSCSPNGISKLFLRKIYSEEVNVIEQCDQDLKKILYGLISNKKNIIVAGSTGSGKTTLLKGLIDLVDEQEHIIIMEDTHELTKTKFNQTSMLAGNKSTNKSLKDYCHYGLRMSPDRLIIGEMRSAEVVPFILSMNTGHKGLLSTIHANSAIDAIDRIALLFSLYSGDRALDYKQIIKLTCKNIDNVIFVKDKKIHQIIKILGNNEETPYYETIYEV